MNTITYQDFDLLIEQTQVGYRARVLNSSTAQARTDFVLPFSVDELRSFLWLTERLTRAFKYATPSGQTTAALDPQAFGERLFNAVFVGDVGTSLLRCLDAAKRQSAGLRIRLRLDPEVAELADLPWEYLYASPLSRFISLSAQTVLVRYIELAQKVHSLSVTLPLKLLVVVANPSDMPTLHAEQEWQHLQMALADLQARGLIAIERLPVATLAALQEHLRKGDVHLLHYIGYGYFDVGANVGGLLLENEYGQSQPVAATQLATLLNDHTALRLIFLNACERARGGRDDAFVSVAQKLVEQGIPAVLAMQFAVSDSAAIALAQEFYEAIADGYPVDTALAEARKAVHGTGNAFEWGTPVLFSRATDNQLFVPLPQLSSIQAPLSTSPPINTGGGAAVRGNVVTGGGDFIGRDNINIFVNNAEEGAKVLGRIPRTIGLQQLTLERQSFEPETVFIPEGPFLMGGIGDDISATEKPQHRVTLPAYRIGKTPITNRQYAEFLKRNKKQPEPKQANWFLRQPPAVKLDHPVVGISWPDACAYCVWLSQATDRTYRLPTEAEWEKAARGPGGYLYPWGNHWIEQHCNVGGADTMPVTTFANAASAYGCLDLLGNVQEWTQTIWGVDENTNDYPYPYDPNDGREDHTASQYSARVLRVHRGGSFRSVASQLRCSARVGSDQETKVKWRGFRVVIEI